MKWTNGDVFSGAWIKDKRNGFGKIEFATGDKYEGMLMIIEG
jgi:hypothetical protein